MICDTDSAFAEEAQEDFSVHIHVISIRSFYVIVCSHILSAKNSFLSRRVQQRCGDGKLIYYSLE